MSTFAELTSIVKDNVLHVTPELSARIPGWIQQAQRRLEERFSWPVMRVRWAGDSVNVDGTTTLGQEFISFKDRIDALFPTLFGEFLRVAPENPYWIEGVTSKEVEIQWAETSAQFHRAPPAPHGGDLGAPRFLYVDRDQNDPLTIQISIWPLPDQLNQVGPSSLAGEYKVRFWMYRRLPTLGGAVTTNWFTQNCADFMEHWASFRAMAYNQDNENANTHLALAKQAMMVHLGTERKSVVGPGIHLRPRADAGYRSSRFSGR